MDNGDDRRVDNELGRLLREVRLRRGLSQEAVALRAGLAVFTYARIERGRSANPTLRTSLRILEVLDIRPEELAMLGLTVAGLVGSVADHLGM